MSNKTIEKPANLETSKYLRKQFPVDAVQVTPDNMESVAKWSGGSIKENGEKEGHLSRKYIKVNVFNAKDEKQTQADLGDWVLKSGNSIKVYTDKAFRKSFEQKR